MAAGGRAGSPHCGLRISLAVAAFLLAVTVVPNLACSSSVDDAPPPAVDEPRRTSSTTARSTTTTSTTPPTPEEAAKAALLQAYEDLYVAAATADPDHPRLVETRSGPNLELVRKLLRKQREDGQVAEFVDEKSPVPVIREAAVRDSDTVLITFCVVDNVRLVRAEDGAVIDDDVVSDLSRAEVRRVERTWRVHSQRGLNSWNDGLGCDR